MGELAKKDRPLLRVVLEFVFPHFCKSCDNKILGNENAYFCPNCWDTSPRIMRPFCIKCGKPHAGMVGYGMPANITCAECRDHPNPHIDRIYGAAIYDASIKEAIRLFKFSNRLLLQKPLGDLLTVFAYEEMEKDAYDYIVPVPLHKVRQRTRGFNQSLALAEEVAPFFENAVVDEALKRIRPTRTQSHLKEEDRENNMRGAFAVIGDEYEGKRILLIDDVVTTSVTVTECARALRRAGAVQVDVLAVALTSHHKTDN